MTSALGAKADLSPRGALVARAQPNGYTLMILPATFPATAAMLQSLPYRPVDDFSFISTISEYPLLSGFVAKRSGAAIPITIKHSPQR